MFKSKNGLEQKLWIEIHAKCPKETNSYPPNHTFSISKSGSVKLDL